MIVILGTGIVGLFSALKLLKNGKKVKLIDIFKVKGSTSINFNFNPYCCKGKYVVLHEIAGTKTSSPNFNGFFFL